MRYLMYIFGYLVNRKACCCTLRIARQIQTRELTIARLFRDSPKRRRTKRDRGRDSLTEGRLRRVAQTGINLNNYAALCG